MGVTPNVASAFSVTQWAREYTWGSGGNFLFGCGGLSREELRREAQEEVARVATPSQLYQ